MLFCILLKPVIDRLSIVKAALSPAGKVCPFRHNAVGTGLASYMADNMVCGGCPAGKQMFFLYQKTFRIPEGKPVFFWFNGIPSSFRILITDIFGYFGKFADGEIIIFSFFVCPPLDCIVTIQIMGISTFSVLSLIYSFDNVFFITNNICCLQRWSVCYAWIGLFDYLR